MAINKKNLMKFLRLFPLNNKSSKSKNKKNVNKNQKELNTNNQSQGGSRASTGSSTSSIIQSGIRTGSSTSSIIQSQLSIPQIDGNIATIRRNGKHINKKIKYKRNRLSKSVISLSGIRFPLTFNLKGIKRNSAEVIPQKQTLMTSQQS